MHGFQSNNPVQFNILYLKQIHFHFPSSSVVWFQSIQLILRPEFFLLVDLQEFFFSLRLGGTKKKKKSSENDPLPVHLQSFFFFFFFLISPEKTVKLVRQTNSLY